MWRADGAAFAPAVPRRRLSDPAGPYVFPQASRPLWRLTKRPQAVIPVSGLVFATAAGQPLHSVNVTRSFHRALKRLGLPQRRFHDLRHTFATLVLEAGEDISIVSRALGHASVATTADKYMHVTPAMRDGLASRMEAVLGSAS